MGMRETVRSLRAYFIFSGLAGVFFAASSLRVSLLDAGVIGVILGLISIGFSLAFVYVGFTLAKAVERFCEPHRDPPVCECGLDRVLFPTEPFGRTVNLWIGHSHFD